jgi:hypothetical protein
MWCLVLGVILTLGPSGCRGRARPDYEYEPTITITTTADAPAPAAAAPTTIPAAPVWRRGEAR